MKPVNPRFIAARVTNEVQHGRSLSASLTAQLPALTDTRDRAFVQALCFGVCRFYTRLAAVARCLLKKPMQKKDEDVYALLLIGLYQLMFMRVPEHAAVSETVDAAHLFNKDWARNIVNAILREYLRKKTEIEAQLQNDEEAFYAHPAWWIKAIKNAWPEDWQHILTANNAHPPFALRVNTQRITREAYCAELNKENIACETVPETISGIVLSEALTVTSLPHFQQGFVSVQDGAAQLAAPLLELAAQQHVLDACAAPGGKLTHILELEPKLAACVALDNDPERIQSIQESLDRLELHAECICVNANKVKRWWNGKLFDRILLDAPCSASGVIRRHPDIKLLRKATDIKTLAKEQLQLLKSLWPLLKPNGILLYATCSIFPEENEQVLEKFLAAHEDAEDNPIEAAWGIKRSIGRQILPGMHNMDGFYYARLHKR